MGLLDLVNYFHLSINHLFQARFTAFKIRLGEVSIICSQSLSSIFLCAATFTLSFSNRLSTSPVIHLAPATPTRKAPARAENLRLICDRSVICANSTEAPEP